MRVLVDNHARFLGFLERRVRFRDVAEEILQEAFVRGIARGASLHDDESAVAWFYRLLRNALIDHIRHAAVEQRALDVLAMEPDAHATSVADPELMNATCACLTNLIPTLKPAYADALRAVDLGGATLQSFADGVGITPGNAAVRLFRARQALRRRVEQSCGKCAVHDCYQCECEPRHV